jgi:hypothetical protein
MAATGSDSPNQCTLVPEGTSTPADLLVTEIGEDYIVGLWRDEMEVGFVHAHRLDRVN